MRSLPNSSSRWIWRACLSGWKAARVLLPSDGVGGEEVPAEQPRLQVGEDGGATGIVVDVGQLARVGWEPVPPARRYPSPLSHSPSVPGSTPIRWASPF